MLNDYIINGIMPDSDNNIWFTTKNSGIFYCRKIF
ncbi:two-component regulator propeller domain-containing protein [Chryseobacterium wanjuense]